ncbi:MAG: DUF488 family protein [Nitrospiria bacterium]
MRLYTIGFTKKGARDFFGILKKHGIKHLLDIRINNTSQLSGYTKKDDLAYFTETILVGRYSHLFDLAPTAQLLKKYHKDHDWQYYERIYLELIKERKVESRLDRSLFEGPSVLLCTEPTADHCHRRLAAQYIKEKMLPEIEIIHL